MSKTVIRLLRLYTSILDCIYFFITILLLLVVIVVLRSVLLLPLQFYRCYYYYHALLLQLHKSNGRRPSREESKFRLSLTHQYIVKTGGVVAREAIWETGKGSASLDLGQLLAQEIE